MRVLKCLLTIQAVCHQNRTQGGGFPYREFHRELSVNSPAKFLCEFYGFRPTVDLTKVDIDSHLTLLISLKLNSSKIAKKLLLARYEEEMSLQFSIEDVINQLVSVTYLTSEEEMQIDDPKLKPKVPRTEIATLRCWLVFEKRPSSYIN